MILNIFSNFFVLIHLFSVSYSQSNEPANFSGKKPNAEQLTFTFYKDANSKPEVYHTTSSSLHIAQSLTVFIIPDHDENSKTEWVEKLRVALLKKYQVVIIDWSIAGGDPNTAKDNTKFVADNLATFITDAKVPANQVILVGLGFGAQIAGLTGKAYTSQNSGQKLFIIIALDPAAAGFEVEKRSKTKIPDSNKLIATDATIVSCTHTNCQKYGVKAATCTIDYYVNDGNVQPGCTDDKDKCSHTRAAEIFLASLEVSNAKAQEASVTVLRDKVAVRTTSTKTELYGLSIGPTSKGIYQLKTTNTPPYLTK
ncbi:unnamed protein product [Psylliodes chrysocephalus]|uniref:Lipase domain-containing protein n=1 Tax=Psylliodes chrysocephalus TaxID=3402493 RepID=A0A9P0G889_9CUCU|nr:unnamed protein product [Psylliodes chrysocephala]